MVSDTKQSANPQLEKLLIEYVSCKACPLYKDRPCYIIGRGNPNAKLVFVVDKFSMSDIRQETVLTDSHENLLMSILKNCNMEMSDVWLTPAVSCAIRDLSDPKISEIKACRERLSKELHYIQPELVVAMGTVAVKAMFPKNPPPIGVNLGKIKDAYITGDLVDYAVPVMITNSISILLRSPDPSPGGPWRKFYANVVDAINIVAQLEKLEKEPIEDERTA